MPSDESGATKQHRNQEFLATEPIPEQRFTGFRGKKFHPCETDWG